MQKKKAKNFYILLVFLLITIVLLIAVNIHFYLMKFKAKQKLVTINVTYNELKEVLYYQ